MLIEFIYTSPVSVAVIAGLILLVLWLFDHIFDSRVYDMDKKRIPGPRSNLYGKNYFNVVHEARRNKRSSEAVKNILIPVLGDGNLCAQNLFGTNIIVISHPDYVKTILSGSYSKFPKGRRYERLKEFLGEGLITTNGDKWATHRTMISPGFHAEVLKHFPTLFSSHSNAMVRRWSEGCTETGGVKTVDMYQDIADLTLSIICDAGFGYTGDSSIASVYAVKIYFEQLRNEMSVKILDPFDWWPVLFPERQRRVKTAFSAIQTLMDAIISNRLQEYQTETTASPSTRPPRDLLDILVQASRGEEAKLTASELRDHILTFFAAGHETTATTLLWVFYELVKQPKFQILCQEELDRIFPVKQGEEVVVAYEDISKCVYLGMVIKEALRLHPPAQMLARRTVEECQIGSYRIPPNSILGVCILAVHRRADFWENPEEFIPDRFHPDNIKGTMKHPFQYIPFSSGARNCIGQRFATLEATTILALILRKFTLKIGDEEFKKIRIEENLTCGPKNMNIVLVPRFPVTCAP